MNTTILILIVFTICFSSVQIILSRIILKRKAIYTAKYKAEVTKSYFARARNEMMRMSIKNEIDANSPIFKELYHLNTVIMRCPDEYPQISAELMKITALNNKKVKDKRELTLTNAEKKIIKITADALGHIIIEYNWILKMLFKSVNTKTEKMHAWSFIMLIFGKNEIRTEKEKIRAEEKINETKQNFYSISGSDFQSSGFATI